jgi:hypothetical protein
MTSGDNEVKIEVEAYFSAERAWNAVFEVAFAMKMLKWCVSLS